METVKAPINERVATKVMPLTKWFVEQYFQTYELMSSDPRFKVTCVQSNILYSYCDYSN